MNMKKVKHETTIMMEKIKQKTGKTEAPKNPNFTIAENRYNEINQDLNSFLRMTEQLLSQFTKLFKISQELTGIVSETVHNIPTDEKIDSIDQLSKLSELLQRASEEKIIKEGTEKVIAPISEVSNKLKELGKKKEECTDVQLILMSNEVKLEKLKKKNQNLKKIADYDLKVKNRTTELALLEETFIQAVNELWVNKINYFGPPMNILSNIITDFISYAGDQSISLQAAVGPQMLQTEFATGEALELKSKDNPLDDIKKLFKKD